MKRLCSVVARLLLKFAAEFALGGWMYYGIETIFRIVRRHPAPLPHTFFLGGGAFVLGLLLCRIPLSRRLRIFLLPLLGSLTFTAYEYLFGLYFLTTQNLRIWNYTGCPFEYRGLICLKFSLCWGALMWVILALDDLIEYLLRHTPFANRNLFKKSQIQNSGHKSR